MDFLSLEGTGAPPPLFRQTGGDRRLDRHPRSHHSHDVLAAVARCPSGCACSSEPKPVVVAERNPSDPAGEADPAARSREKGAAHSAQVRVRQGPQRHARAEKPRRAPPVRQGSPRAPGDADAAGRAPVFPRSAFAGRQHRPGEARPSPREGARYAEAAHARGPQRARHALRGPEHGAGLRRRREGGERGGAHRAGPGASRRNSPSLPERPAAAFRRWEVVGRCPARRTAGPAAPAGLRIALDRRRI